MMWRFGRIVPRVSPRRTAINRVVRLVEALRATVGVADMWARDPALEIDGPPAMDLGRASRDGSGVQLRCVSEYGVSERAGSAPTRLLATARVVYRGPHPTGQSARPRPWQQRHGGGKVPSAQTCHRWPENPPKRKRSPAFSSRRDIMVSPGPEVAGGAKLATSCRRLIWKWKAMAASS